MPKVLVSPVERDALLDLHYGVAHQRLRLRAMTTLVVGRLAQLSLSRSQRLECRLHMGLVSGFGAAR
jgi:hypothetical protein